MDNGAITGNIVRLLATGYSPDHARAATALRYTLLEGISALKGLGHPTEEPMTETNIEIHTGFDAPRGGLPFHSDLLTLWEEFAVAMCQSAANGNEECRFINLWIHNVQLPREILSILEPALKIAPLNLLGFSNNDLGREGIKFVVHTLEQNTLIRMLSLERNEIEHGPETMSFLQAAQKNTGLRLLDLHHCGIGGKLSVSPEIVPALLHLRSVHLPGNMLGSYGANLISSCLASNPDIKKLYLDNNMFNDEDATLFADSLKSNTTLLRLSMCGNNFTDAGIKSLYNAIYDDQSLNSIRDSNHTCLLELFADRQAVPIGINMGLLAVNGKNAGYKFISHLAMKRCIKSANEGETITHEILCSYIWMRIKMQIALQGGSSGYFKCHYLDHVNMKLVPRVMVFLQKSGKYNMTEERSLDNLFQVICSRPVDFCRRPPKDTALCLVRDTKTIKAKDIAAAIAVPMFAHSHH